MAAVLRSYQERVIRLIWHWFRENKKGNPLVWMPTGSGKSHIIAEIGRVAVQHPGQKILVITPSKELCDQDYQKMLDHLGPADVGILSASMQRYDLDARIIVSTIGTAYNRAAGLGKVSLIIIDEAHRTSNENVGMIRKLVARLNERTPNLRILGLTATPFRGSGVWLHRTKSSLFTEIAAKITIDELVAAGHLCRIAPAKTKFHIDAKDVKTFGTGDYVISDLVKKWDVEEVTQKACAEMVALGKDQKSWIVFCCTVKHAENVWRELTGKHAIDAELIVGTTHRKDRESMVRRHRSGELRCLVSVAVLTTGFDSPGTDFIALLRNTRSPIMWVQLVGRAMRPHPNKSERPALIADFTDTSLVMGPVDKIQGRDPRKTWSAPVMKTCPSCGCVVAGSTVECPECGHVFPRKEPKPKVNGRASGVEVLGKSELHTYQVDRVFYTRHRKQGKPDSMRVDYFYGIRRLASEWVCVEHTGYAKHTAAAWWLERYPGGRQFQMEMVPKSVDVALTLAPRLKKPAQIVVNLAAEHPKIVLHKYLDDHRRTGTTRSG